MYQNDNNNKMRKINKKGQRGVGWERERERDERIFLFIFLSLAYFSDLRKLDHIYFVGAECKVDLRDESYAWTPKS